MAALAALALALALAAFAYGLASALAVFNGVRVHFKFAFLVVPNHRVAAVWNVAGLHFP